ncbi:MAG: hypothetical protein Tsb0020_52610 [Haliangiales bacterium]
MSDRPSKPPAAATDDSSPAPARAHAGDDEPRVGELLSGRVSEETLDPETVAQLAAWFGGTSMSAVSGGEAPPPPAAQPQRAPASGQAPAIEGVDDAFVAALMDKWANAPIRAAVALLRPAPTSIPRGAPSRFDLTRWRMPADEPMRAYERPEYLEGALREPVPQAILRDLHRPQQQWTPRLLPNDLGLGAQLGGSQQEAIRAVIDTPYAVRMDDEPVAAHFISQDISALRSQLRDEPWADSYVPPEERAHQTHYLPTEADLRWFGIVGIDPDL